MATVKTKLTYDSAKEKLAGVKEEIPAKETQLKEYAKKNKMKGGKSEDKKIQSGYNKVTQELQDLKDRKSKYIKFMKENKPKVDRESKYAYPDDCKTGLDKKKFRSLMRARAKRAKVDVDTYLADPKKYDKLIAEKDAAKSAGKSEKKKKKGAKEEAPKKKLKVVEKKKKKAAPEPEETEEEEVEEVEETEEEEGGEEEAEDED